MNSLFGLAKLCLGFALAVGATVLTGCQTPQHTFPRATSAGTNGTPGETPVSIPSSLVPASPPQRDSIDFLRPGYKVTITFSGVPNPPPKHEEKIREDGYISPPLLKRPVSVSGKTIGTLQEELQGLYVPDYFRTLTVTVTTEDRFIFVGGEVRTEGPRPCLPGMTVLTSGLLRMKRRAICAMELPAGTSGRSASAWATLFFKFSGTK